ncbi:hypothetical protein FKW77_005383 [Venturia effusa]|uniref:Uncharacterized protein n=1 Tax=Venturia effusa TaxID=50376 RepID=A0A517LQD4_9PEZI|nr:hypothetical protein FKW77_005383 [Venturia effusa]
MGPKAPRKASSVKAPSASGRPQRVNKPHPPPAPSRPAQPANEEVEEEHSSEEENEDDGDATYMSAQSEPAKPHKQTVAQKPRPADPVVNEDSDGELSEPNPELANYVPSEAEHDRSATILADQNMEDQDSDAASDVTDIPEGVSKAHVERMKKPVAQDPASTDSDSGRPKRKNDQSHTSPRSKRRKADRKLNLVNANDRVEARDDEGRSGQAVASDHPVTGRGTAQPAPARKVGKPAPATKPTTKPAAEENGKAAPPAAQGNGKGRAVEPVVEPAPIANTNANANGDPDDDDSDDSSDSSISADSDSESDPDDMDLDLNDNAVYDTFQREMGDITQTIGTYVTGTANEAMHRLNAKAKAAEKRRKDRRRQRKMTRRAHASRMARRNREVRPRSPVTTGGTENQTGPKVGGTTTQPLDTSHEAVHQETSGKVDVAVAPTSPKTKPTKPSTNPQPAVHPTEPPQARPPPPPPIGKPSATTEPMGSGKTAQRFCRHKASRDPGGPGCQRQGKNTGPNPLQECGFARCTYAKFCLNCKEGRDSSGKPVESKRGKPPPPGKGIKVEDDEVEAGYRWYCSKSCFRKDKEDGNKDDNDTQVRCRSQTSKEDDEPGCGRKFTWQNMRVGCSRECGKKKFCVDCVNGIVENGNDIKRKGIRIDDEEDDTGGYWFYCSKECKRLDDKETEKGNGEASGKPTDGKPGTDKKSGDDGASDSSSDPDEPHDENHCQNKFCGKPFSKTKKRRQCENPNCVKNKSYCIGCTNKTSLAKSKGEKPSGRWTQNPEKWYCCKECRQPFENQLEEEDLAREEEKPPTTEQRRAERNKKIDEEKALAAKRKKAKDQTDEESDGETDSEAKAEKDKADAAEAGRLKMAAEKKKTADAQKKADKAKEVAAAKAAALAKEVAAEEKAAKKKKKKKEDEKAAAEKSKDPFAAKPKK